MNHRGDEVCVVPYNVPDDPEAIQEALRTGNFVRARVHGLRPKFPSLGMRITVSEDGDMSWEDWDGQEKEAG